VSTFALCTVPDPAGTLVEVLRILRPGGKFVFMEHVVGGTDEIGPVVGGTDEIGPVVGGTDEIGPEADARCEDHITSLRTNTPSHGCCCRQRYRRAAGIAAIDMVSPYLSTRTTGILSGILRR
jgi:SAM-dependent methyltransferase